MKSSGKATALRHPTGWRWRFFGWLVLFRPEFLFLPQLEGSSDDLHLVGILARHPEPLPLHKHELDVVMGIVAQMHEDAKLDAFATEVQALLRHQLCALLVRIGIVRRRHVAEHLTVQSELQRFRSPKSGMESIHIGS